MTAEAIGMERVGQVMPATVTLSDVAALNSGDQHGHRYELSPEGVLTVVPPPESGHAMVATDLTLWLGAAGWTGERLMQATGIRIAGPDGEGGRIPDLSVWARPQRRDAVWLEVDDLLLVIEIVSRGSTKVDHIEKVDEYAAAGIPQYWTVAHDAAQTVTMYRLRAGNYEIATKVPLAWLLQTSPADHLPSPGESSRLES